jgi:acyl-CoA synthetase (AMP-forming)/AMP-acid ligase II
LQEGHEATAGELLDYCRAHLADFKCPKTIIFLPDLPKGPTGKVLKRELAEKYKSPMSGLS